MTAKAINVEIKFPKGLSQRDKNLILDDLRSHFKKRADNGESPKDLKEANLWARAYVEEHWCLGTRLFKPKSRIKRGKGFRR